MKTNKKICIMILTGIYIFFISIFNVKAQIVTNTIWNSQEYHDTGANGYKTITLAFDNRVSYTEDGTLLINVGYKSNYMYAQQIIIYASSGDFNVCDIGNVSTFLDSSVQLNLLTLKCPVNKNTQYWGIKFNNAIKLNDGSIYKGYNATFVSSDIANGNGNNTDYTNVLNSININISNIFGIMTEWRWAVAGQYGLLNDIKGLLSGNSTTIQNIEDKMNEDIDTDSKTAPDQTQYNTAKAQEESIIQSISNVSANDITFSQDIQASNKIWETTTRFLQTNAKVMGLVISILSIGIIKLIMNR